MFWVQGGISFLLWIAYGVIQSRRSHLIREYLLGIPRKQRKLLGPALFVVGMMVLFGGLGIALQQGGFTDQGMTIGAWIGITALVLVFIHAQTMGMAILVTLIQPDVTKNADAASINRSSGDSTQP